LIDLPIKELPRAKVIYVKLANAQEGRAIFSDEDQFGFMLGVRNTPLIFP
jgi:hypothetical protein